MCGVVGVWVWVCEATHLISYTYIHTNTIRLPPPLLTRTLEQRRQPGDEPVDEEDALEVAGLRLEQRLGVGALFGG